MSARVCYLKRGWRGGSIASVHLISLTGEERLAGDSSRTGEGELAGEILPEAAARFIGDTLAQMRGPANLAMLCLDAEGSAASWVASPTHDRSAIASLVRLGQHGGEGDGSRMRASPLEQIGQDAFASSIEPLSGDVGASPGLLTRRKADTTTKASERVGVLSMVDAPARVLIDELDRRGVTVEGVASVWHAMAQALDPTADGVEPAHAPVVAIVAAETDGRVLWAWSRGRQLLAAGAIRAVAQVSADGSIGVGLGDAEAARIVNDWLAWGAQLCVAPARVIAVLPEGDDLGQGARGFALRLGSSWQDATVDATVAPDPMALVLRRLAERIEGTPDVKSAAEPTPTTRLVGLSTRPGKRHRAMMRWGAAGVLTAAGVCVVLGLRIRAAAEDAQSTAREWSQVWRPQVEAAYPAALLPQPGKSARAILQEEVDRQRARLAPPPAIDPAPPLLQELETLSLVLANADVAIRTISMDSRLPTIEVVALCRDLAYAERLGVAIGEIDRSWVANWEVKIARDTTDSERPFRVTLTARWTQEARAWAEQAETGRAPAEGGA